MNNNNPKYKYSQLNSEKITSDPSYQRAVDFNRVKRIASNFNPALVNPIKVSLRGGKYYVFDGQHTLAALRMVNGNKDLMVECKIYTGLTQQDEARLFSEQNGLSRAVASNSKMKALYTAGDVSVVELHDLLESVGIKFDFSSGKGQNKIIACSTTFNIYKKSSKGEFIDIIEIIKGAWGGDPESFNKEILGGMYAFYAIYKNQYSKKKAISQFSKVSPQEIIRNGKLFKDGGDHRFARQLMIAYNKNLRTGKVDENLLGGY